MPKPVGRFNAGKNKQRLVKLFEKNNIPLIEVELPKSIKSIKLFEQTLEKKIAIASGEIFSPSASYTHHIRLNCGDGASDLEKVRKAIIIIGELAKKLL